MNIPKLPRKCQLAICAAIVLVMLILDGPLGLLKHGAVLVFEGMIWPTKE